MGKYAVITGASSGIGVEFARRLAAKGYALVLVARREDRLKELAVRLGKKTECEVCVADLTQRAECEKLCGWLADKDVEVFINNAGFGDCGQFVKTNLDKELDMIRLNVAALHLLTKRMIKRFEERGGGYLLNVASAAGLLPAGPYMATYYATKAYVTSLTRAVAQELKEAGSRVYIGCLCPGPVDTEFNEVANVEFALKGIRPGYCAGYALDLMFHKRKTVIVPTLLMKFASAGARFLPVKVAVAAAGIQQKRKARQ
ncbi:MAG: SDR family oxidoreductase [Lachnospiraceae bacterium]|nr:SDR family oxidoreductase [Lachnospiraceae bacterium]